MMNHNPNKNIKQQSMEQQKLRNQVYFADQDKHLSQSLSLLNSRMRIRLKNSYSSTSKDISKSNCTQYNQKLQYQRDQISQSNEQDNIRAVKQFQIEIEQKFNISVANKIYTFPRQINNIFDIISSDQQNYHQSNNKPKYKNFINQQKNKIQHNNFINEDHDSNQDNLIKKSSQIFNPFEPKQKQMKKSQKQQHKNKRNNRHKQQKSKNQQNDNKFNPNFHTKYNNFDNQPNEQFNFKKIKFKHTNQSLLKLKQNNKTKQGKLANHRLKTQIFDNNYQQNNSSCLSSRLNKKWQTIGQQYDQTQSQKQVINIPLNKKADLIIKILQNQEQKQKQKLRNNQKSLNEKESLKEKKSVQEKKSHIKSNDKFNLQNDKFRRQNGKFRQQNDKFTQQNGKFRQQNDMKINLSNRQKYQRGNTYKQRTTNSSSISQKQTLTKGKSQKKQNKLNLLKT